MKNTYAIALLGSLLVLGGMFVFRSSGTDAGAKSVLTGQEITIYKTETCGCCHVYAQYLKQEGAPVTTIDVADLSTVKEQYAIPSTLQSCHTSVVGGYVVEGHIPLAVIEKLLSEKPTITGIALPGMPSGSPGMPGPKTEKWTIYAIGTDGAITEFTRY